VATTAYTGLPQLLIADVVSDVGTFMQSVGAAKGSSERRMQATYYAAVMQHFGIANAPFWLIQAEIEAVQPVLTRSRMAEAHICGKARRQTLTQEGGSIRGVPSVRDEDPAPATPCDGDLACSSPSTASPANWAVGTLYQYFPDKRALLYAALEDYLISVLGQFERACELSRGQPLLTMVEYAIIAFVEAKTHDRAASTAILELSWDFRIDELVSKLRDRAQAAFVKMLRTASDDRLRDPELAVTLIHSAMHSAFRAMIEAASIPQKLRILRADLIRMCRGYVREAQN